MLDLHRYWSARRPSDGSLPGWRDLDLLDMRAWLGRVSLYEACPDGDLRIRVRGSLKIDIAGQGKRGFRVSRIRPAVYARLVLPQLCGSMDEARPTRHVVELELDGLRHAFDRLALPLAPAGDEPARLLTFVTWDPRRSRAFWNRYKAAAGL